MRARRLRERTFCAGRALLLSKGSLVVVMTTLNEKRRLSVYVTVEDARNAPDAFASGDEIARRSEHVATNRSLIMVYAHEEKACIALRMLQGQGTATRTVFCDIFGNPFKYTTSHTRDGKWIPAYFSGWPSECEDRSESTPAVSPDHEAAVSYAARLAMKNQLKAGTLCAHSTHKAVDVAEAWVPLDMKGQCISAIAVDGVGDGLEVVIGYRWLPDRNDSAYFVLDTAVLRNGRLHIAVEIQRSHPNSTQKREAFEKHGVRGVQISSGELNGKCRSRNWDSESGGDVFVANHPITSRDLWFCRPCETRNRTEANRLRALAIQEAKKQERRDAFEKDKLSTFRMPQDNKWLKGYVFVPPKREVYSSDSNMHVGVVYKKRKVEPTWFCMRLNESHYHHQNNPRPAFFSVLVHESNRSRLNGFDSKPVCLFLACLKADRNDATKKIMWMRAGADIPFVAGLDLPGFEGSPA